MKIQEDIIEAYTVLLLSCVVLLFLVPVITCIYLSWEGKVLVLFWCCICSLYLVYNLCSVIIAIIIMLTLIDKMNSQLEFSFNSLRFCF